MISYDFKNNFVRTISPSNLVLFAVGYYVLFYIVSPIQTENPIQVLPVIYSISAYILFYIGSRSSKYRNDGYQYFFSEVYLKKVLNYTIVLGAFGVILKLIDRFFIRGFSFGAAALENREIGENMSSNIYSLVGSMFFLFAIISFWITILNSDKLNRIKKYISWILFFYLLFEGFLLGSRFAIIINVFFLIYYLFFLKKIKFRLSIKNVLSFIVVVLLFLTFSSMLFIDRLNYMKIPIEYVIKGAEGNFAETVPVSVAYKRFMFSFSEDSFIFSLLFGWLNLCQYIVHSFFEFQLLFKHSEYHNLSILYGADEFQVFSKFFSKVLGTSLDSEVIDSHYPRLGKFTTFWGPYYNDWGWFGLLFMFPLGRYVKKLWVKLYIGDFRVAPLYTFISLIILFAPVLNYLRGTGSYMIFTFIIFSFLTRVIKGVYINKI